MCSQYKILPNVRFFFLIKLAIDLIYIIHIILIFANMSAFILMMARGTRRRVDVGEKK